MVIYMSIAPGQGHSTLYIVLARFHNDSVLSWKTSGEKKAEMC